MTKNQQLSYFMSPFWNETHSEKNMKKKLDIQKKPATDYLVIIKYENERIYFKFTFTLKQFSKLNQLN